MTAMANPTEYREASGFIAEIIRTNRRKSADIRVEEGAVSIVVPSDTPLEKIDQLLASKRRWIKEKMALHQQAAPASSREFVSGEAFPYLGHNYRLKVETGAFAPVKLLHGRLLITRPRTPAHGALIQAPSRTKANRKSRALRPRRGGIANGCKHSHI